jgi:Fe-S cluster biogenesis protein NfuA
MAETATGPAAGRRLGGDAVAEILNRLDEALASLERTPGATAETALDAVTMMTEVYGEALARVLDRVSADDRLLEALVTEELLGHLMVLHGIHPEPAERRIVRALEELRPMLLSGGTDAQFEALEGRTARILLTGDGGGCGGGCGSGEPVEDSVREAVLAVAPDVEEVVLVRPKTGPAAFVPLDALRGHRIATPGPP